MGRRDAETETLIPTTGAVFDDALGVAHSLRGEGFDASEDGTGRGTPLVPVAFPAEMSGTQRASAEDVSPALSVKHTTAVAFSIMPMNSGRDYKARETDVAQPLMAGGPVGGNQGGDFICQPPAVAYPINMQIATRHNSLGEGTGLGIGSETDPAFTLLRDHHHAVGTYSAVRRLTPRECERLQGFPDNWTMIPWRKKPAEQCPDGPRYKALGNSMPVPCMRWLGERIQQVENLISAQGAA